MKIYAISGLGADERVFDYLRLDVEIIPILWITPLKSESIQSYALRLSKKIDTSEDFIILGLSFGGLVANEISKILKPKATILISTIEVKSEIPLLYRFIGNTKVLNLIPKFILRTSNIFITYLFGTKEKKLLKEIIEDSNVTFSKWAVLQLVSWQNETRLKNCLKIHGSKDKLLPAPKDAVIIENGEHFMIVDYAEEVSRVINDFVKEIIN